MVNTMPVNKTVRNNILAFFGVSSQRVIAEAKRAGMTPAEWYQTQLPLYEHEKKRRASERRALNRERSNELARIRYATATASRREAVKMLMERVEREKAQREAKAREQANARVHARTAMNARRDAAALTIQRKWREAQMKRAVSVVEVPGLVRLKRAAEPLKPFELTMVSSMNSEVKLRYGFKNLYHFNSWAEKNEKMIANMENGTADNATGSDGEAPETGSDIQMFQHVRCIITTIEGGATNDRKPIRTLKLKHYKITIAQKREKHNNCGPKCVIALLSLKCTPLQMRRACGLSTDTQVGMTELLEMYSRYASVDESKPLVIHTKDTDFIDTERCNNIYYNERHYSVITEATIIPKDPANNVKRGMLFWDIETRKIGEDCYSVLKKDKNDSGKRLYHIQDAITHLYYRDYKSDEYKSLSFATNENKSSLRQFIDWLTVQSRAGKHYHAYAHNGGNFDLYFLLASFTQEEKTAYEPMLRGSTIIKLEFCGHIFLDTMCFMANSLAKLSEDYKVATPKLKEFVVAGKPLTSMQICFYKPYLSIMGFMALEKSEPEFWAAYNEYCRVDCVALSQIWTKFVENTSKLMERFVAAAPIYKNELMSRCCLRQSCTIGGHAQKILNTLNGTREEKKMQYAYSHYSKFINGEQDKHDFIMNNFKRGGISHCNQMGKHVEGVASVDVTSQYPTAMAGMKIPCGYSRWVGEYEEDAHGFYELEDLEFTSELAFKPVCTVKDNGVLEWKTGKSIPKLHADSYMIKYLQEHFGLTSFKVVRGLVSKYELEGREIFGKYVDVLFAEKATQDELKAEKSPEYNNSYREAIKLYLNAVTGKLVMNKSKYSSLKQISQDDIDGESTRNINGVEYRVEIAKDPMNPWVVAGVMVYSFSKRQLFDYIRCLPGDSASVIHVETDSIYFPKRMLPEFKENLERYEGSYGCKFGSELGSVKVEMDTSLSAYFLNKKFYTIHDGKKYKYVAKGIPAKTISADGSDVQILNLNIYERVYEHKPGDAAITVEFSSLTRQLTTQTCVKQVTQTRTIKSLHCYQLYE